MIKEKTMKEYHHVKHYEEIADALLDLKDNKAKFVCIAKEILNNTGWKTTIKQKSTDARFDTFQYIDPLTLMAIINGYTKKRVSMLNKLCKLLNLDIVFKDDELFYGISILNNSHRLLCDYRDETKCKETNMLLWRILENAIKYADKELEGEETLKQLVSDFNFMQQSIPRSWDRLTHILSYIRPNTYIALSSPNRKILKNQYLFNSEVNEYINSIKLCQINGEDYFLLCKCLLKNAKSFGTLIDLSRDAYEEHIKIKELKDNYNKQIENEKHTQHNKNIEDLKKKISVKAPTLKEFLSSNYGRSYYTREVSLHNSGYVCEFDDSHRYFISKATNMNYVETHHIIPVYHQRDEKFKNVNLDIPENVAVLCPICHLKIHRGKKSEAEEILKMIYSKKKEQLSRIYRINQYSELLKLYSYKE